MPQWRRLPFPAETSKLSTLEGHSGKIKSGQPESLLLTFLHSELPQEVLPHTLASELTSGVKFDPRTASGGSRCSPWNRVCNHAVTFLALGSTPPTGRENIALQHCITWCILLPVTREQEEKNNHQGCRLTASPCRCNVQLDPRRAYLSHLEVKGWQKVFF